MDGWDVFLAIFYGGVFILVAGYLIALGKEKYEIQKENPQLYEIINHYINKAEAREFVTYLIKLRDDKDWGKLIAFSGNRAYGDRYAFFEEGLYFKVDDYSAKEMFIPKDQLSIEFSKSTSLYEGRTYIDHYIDIKFTKDDKIIDLRIHNMNKLGEAIEKQTKSWYSGVLEQGLEQNVELAKRYSSFVTKLKKFQERYKTISFPIGINDINLGEYVTSINMNIILGVDSKKNIGLFVSDETIFEIDYDDFIDYSVEGKLDITRELYGGEKVQEGKWDGKRIATGLVLAGPIGAALIGKSKTKYSEYNYRTTDVKDSRRLVIRTARVKAIYRLNSDFEYVNSTEEFINNKQAGFLYNNNRFVLPFEFYNTLENYFPEKIFKDKYEI